MTTTQTNTTWPLWRRIAFRFFFIYIVLNASPLGWLDAVPGFNYLLRFYYVFVDWVVTKANSLFFHVRPVLVPVNGSGDTSWGWAEVWTALSIAIIGCMVWSILDRKRLNYTKLNYWLCLIARYYVAMIALSYGILKVLALQMYFPNLHQLATPLGDLLPMRLSWLFIGYSKSYQVFSGVMEVFVGLLLLNRRTATLGAFLSVGVFANVMMLNLSYDIPVKIFSMHLTFISMFLLANEASRLFYFFVLNKPAPIADAYHFHYTQKWMRIGRIIAKVVFIVLAVVVPIINNLQYYKETHAAPAKQSLGNGVYEVKTYAINNKEIPLTLSDTLRWQDFILENGTGSIKTGDTTFRQRYKRGYFAYTTDSVNHLFKIKKLPADSLWMGSFLYETPDASTIKLRGKLRNDSLYIELRKTNRHFQLAEKQFHWLSERNR
jgi:hypothetical protein